MNTKNTKILLAVIVLLLFVLTLLIYRLQNFEICMGSEYCIIYATDKGKVRRMNFDDDQKYSFITIEGKSLDKIEGLEGQDKLEELDLADNNITQIEGLEGLKSLRSLDLSNNHINTIDGIEGLSSLENLYLQDNPINTIENIETTNSKKLANIYVPYDLEYITQDSYDYINTNAIEVYFVHKGADVHKAGKDKKIEDLTIV